MGTVPATEIQKAADHLLGQLRDRGEVVYSTTYFDGSDVQEHRLHREMQIEPGTGGASPAILIDIAVYQLENAGWVEKEELNETLVDGEPDYKILFTAEGRRALAVGELFQADHEVL